MGIRANWLAMEGVEPRRLLDALGLQEAGATWNEWDCGQAYTVTRKGWIVVLSPSMRLDLPRLLPDLSRVRPLLAGEASETVMSSSLQAWRDGKSLWSVSHDPDRALDDLTTAGEPPAELAEIAARLAAEQAEEDESVDVIFEAPLELCKQLCGYRPDEVVPGPWIELEPRPGRVGGPAPSALPEAIRRDLAPTLADHGWAAGEVRISANGERYDRSRLREARLEAMRLLWSDDGRTPLITASFAILDGSTPDAPLIGVQAVVPDPPSLTRRLLGWAKTFRQDAQTDETRIRDAIVQGRALIADLDAAIDTAVDLGLRRREAHRQAYGGDAPERD